MSTTATIFLVCAIKGVLAAVLTKYGWWPDWEKRALRKQEHKRVIKAYEHWCDKTGQRPAADEEALRQLELRRS